MAGRSSARPQDLATFSQQAGGVTRDLQTWITKLTGTYLQFQQACSWGRVESHTAEQTLPALVTRQQNVITFVELVKAAFETADSGSLGNGVVSLSDTELQARYEWVARQNGLDPALFDTIPTALAVPPVVTGAIPETSGFVDDPVCTATGHFLEDEVDFAVPDRLAVLAWPRRYSSRLLDPGPFGRGWWTWASARLALDERGDAAYRGPDGRQLTFAAAPDGGWARVPGIGAGVSAGAGGEGLDLRWDAATTFELQHWHFDGDGRLVTISGPTLGTTTLHHDGDRLVRLVHEGGRALDLAWRGDRIVEAALSDGRTVRYAYDGAGDLTGVERADGARRYEPDEAGRIVAVYDADGVRLCRNTFDDDGRVLSQVSPLGRETVFEYLPGRVTRISDTTGGPVAIFEHDATGRVTGLINALGDRFERTFDERGRVVRQRHFDGSTREQAATGDPATVEVTDGSGGWERWRYDETGRVTAHQSSTDQAVRFDYEGESSLPARITAADGARVEISWRDGMPVSVTDADGVRVDIAYDTDGCAVRVEDALGAVTEMARHACGQASVIRHADGTETHLGWDDAGRFLSLRDPTGATGHLERSPAGRVVAVVDPEGARTEVAYASSGMVERVTDPLGRHREVRFDVLGNVVGMTEPNGGKWELDWSVLGQLSLIHAPDGTTCSIARDAEGRPTAVTDPLGRVLPVPTGDAPMPDPGAGSPITRTPAGRPATVTDRSGRRASYGYDAAGRLATVTLPGGGVWRHERDARGRAVAVISPEGRRTTYGYDGAGRVTEVRRGSVRRAFRYDGCGRVVAVIDGTGATTRYRYDPAGQLVGATDARGVTVECRYDELGKLVEVIDPSGAAVVTTRDVMGRPVEQRDPLGRATTWSYDAMGRPTGVTLATGERIDALPPERPDTGPAVTRDGDGRITSRGSGARVEQFEHDADGRVIRVRDSRFGTIELTRDGDGLLTGLSAAGLQRAWAYDEGGRLVGYREQTAGGGRETGLRRDAAGRVIGVADRVEGGAEEITAYDYDAAGQLVGVRGPDGERTFVYDAAGRLVAETGPGGERRLAYDAAGQLTTIEHGPRRTTFAYDPAGRRVAESGPGGDRRYRWGARGELREIVHDGRVTRVEVSPAGELAGVADRAVKWNGTAPVAHPRQIGDEHVLVVAGMVVATATGDDPAGGIRWCSADWRGSVAARDAWGRGEATGPAGLGFGGEVELDGLVWLRHRILDPATGQFLTRDPLAGVAGTPVATFPYHYAGNDPIGFVDPLGLNPVSIDRYNEIRDQDTGIQWQNVITAVVVVGGAALCVAFPGAALILGPVFGALSSATPHVYDSTVNDEPMNWGKFGKDVAFGAAFGLIGGGAGSWAAKTAAKAAAGQAVSKFGAGLATGMKTWTGEITQGAVFGFAGSATSELYDLTGLGGADGDFDWGGVVNNTWLSAGGGALGKGLSTKVGGHGADAPGPAPMTVDAPVPAPRAPLAIEAPPVRLAIEGPPPPPPVQLAPEFSSPPQVDTPMPGGPHGSTDLVFSSGG